MLDSVLIALDSVDDTDIAAGDVPTLGSIETVGETIGFEADGMRDDADLPVLRPKPRRETTLVRKRGDVFVVRSRRAVRIAALLNEEDWNARVQFLGYLQRAGVVRALEDAGVLPGDTVRFGEVEWEWE